MIVATNSQDKVIGYFVYVPRYDNRFEFSKIQVKLPKLGQNKFPKEYDKLLKKWVFNIPIKQEQCLELLGR